MSAVCKFTCNSVTRVKKNKKKRAIDVLQSTAALDMVRKDLAEFGCTMQQDTGHVVGVTSTTLKESLKVGKNFEEDVCTCSQFLYCSVIVIQCVRLNH